MNCAECRQELELRFGEEKLDAKIADHLAQCIECRTYRTELDGLATGLSEDVFVLDGATVEGLAQQVDERVARLDARRDAEPYERADRRSLWSWVRAVPAAAAIVLVVGVGVTGYWLGRWEVKSVATTAEQQSTPLSEFIDEEETEPDEVTVRVLLDDFTRERRLDASEYLLDGISEEELRYLESNFDIGEIL
jgi:hypothetical protein